MPKNYACEEKWSKCTKEQTLSNNNCSFISLTTIIAIIASLLGQVGKMFN